MVTSPEEIREINSSKSPEDNHSFVADKVVIHTQSSIVKQAQKPKENRAMRKNKFIQVNKAKGKNEETHYRLTK